MKKNLYKNVIVLILLTFIGLAVHFKSFQMVPYGDDWRFIYNYFTREEVVANFSPFPGIFAFMAPYGPSALTIGFLYQVFGDNYYIYYLVPLIFKILTAFVIFLTFKEVSRELKKDNTLTGFLSAVLFLVGSTGIQAIDWAFHINVYIAFFILSLSLLFQIRFYIDGGKWNLLLALFLSLFSIVTAPFRLLSIALLSPLIDLILLTAGSFKKIFLAILLKNTIFLIFIFIFFWVGLFGHSPQDLYSPFPITNSLKQIMAEPVLSAKTFLHWIGITILPAYPAGSPNSYLIGMVFLIFLLAVFYKYRGKYILLGSAFYLIPLFLMWLLTPTRMTDSGDRYLPLPFLALSFLLGWISLILNKKLNKIFTAVMLTLVLIQAYSTVNIYSYWLSGGRGADFAVPAQAIIMKQFPRPITEPKIVYLDFDDPFFQQSIEFGLGYRIAVLSGTKGLNNFPVLINNKNQLMKIINGKLANGSLDQILGSIYTFQFKNKIFTDVSETFREETKKELTK